MIALFVTVQVSTSRKLWGGMISIFIAQVFVFFFLLALLSLAKVLLTSVLKCFVLTGHFTLCAFLSCSFRLKSKLCFLCVVAAGTTAASSLEQQASPYTLWKIPMRSTARKCGIGMVSKLWLHLFFCHVTWLAYKTVKLLSLTVHDWVPVTAICPVFRFLSCVKHFEGKEHVQWNFVLVILLQEVRPASTRPQQEDQQQEDSWRWVGLVRWDWRGKGRICMSHFNVIWKGWAVSKKKKKKREE